MMTETAMAESATTLWGVQTNELHMAWPMVGHMIEAALERGGQHTVAEIYRDLTEGAAQLWVAWADEAQPKALGVCVTYTPQYAGGLACRIYLCTGEDRKRWIHHLQTIEEWAKSIGCNKVIAVVRPGWEKLLGEYKKTHVTLERKL